MLLVYFIDNPFRTCSLCHFGKIFYPSRYRTKPDPTRPHPPTPHLDPSPWRKRERAHLPVLFSASLIAMSSSSVGSDRPFWFTLYARNSSVGATSSPSAAESDGDKSATHSTRSEPITHATHTQIFQVFVYIYRWFAFGCESPIGTPKQQHTVRIDQKGIRREEIHTKKTC